MVKLTVQNTLRQQFRRFYLGTNGKQTAQLYIGGALKLGSYETEGETYSRNLIVRQFDTKERRQQAFLYRKIVLIQHIGMPGRRQRIMTGFTYKIYKNEEINLVTVNASLDEEYSTNRLRAQF